MKLDNPIAIGNTAKVYLYDNKIIKVFNDFLTEMESSYEANKQKFAYSAGLSVPEVFEVTTIDGKQAIIMEYVKGKTIGDLLSENKHQTEYYLPLSIDIQQKIHSIHADFIEPMSTKLRKQIVAAKSLELHYKDALLEKLETIPYKPMLCHGDFHLYNLILPEQNSQVKIIDWVDASAGDIRADVYRTYLLYEQFSTELATMYLHMYCDKSGISKEDIFQWAPIIAGARLSENVSQENREHLLKIVHSYMRD